jgi:hypothetical protein
MRMSNFQAKLASAVLIGLAANVCTIAMPGGGARAADSCITEPKPENAQGKHWYYRLERGTGRHCWYLRGEDEASARTPSVEPVAAAKPAPQTAGMAPSRSLSDARAEFAPKARVDDANAAASRSVWPDPSAPAATTTGIGPGAPSGAVSNSQVTTQWPQAAPSPALEASPMVADAQPGEQVSATQAAPAGTPIMREVGSLQKLVLVAFGALALAGITGSTVYRLAGARGRNRQQQRWPQRRPPTPSPSLAEQARGAPWVAPELSPDAPPVELVSDRIEAGKSEDSFEKIEDFLARLTRQLHDELEASRPAELENPSPH